MKYFWEQGAIFYANVAYEINGNLLLLLSKASEIRFYKFWSPNKFTKVPRYGTVGLYG